MTDRGTLTTHATKTLGLMGPIVGAPDPVGGAAVSWLLVAIVAFGAGGSAHHVAAEIDRWSKAVEASNAKVD